MTQKNISFWFCTLLSGIVIGIASQRIPESRTIHENSKSQSNSFYCKEGNLHQGKILAKSSYSLAYDGYNNSTWVYEHFTKDRIQRK